MIRRLALLLALWISPATSASAASFVARVDSGHVIAGQSFILQLTLSGAGATGDPDIGALKQTFTIVSEAQSSNTTNINGVVSSSVEWQLAIIPRREGQLAIPSVSVETGAGPLRTAPIRLEVGQEASPASSQTTSDGSMVSVTAKAATTTPYQNQSMQFVVRFVVRGNVSDVSLSDINVNNAIVEPAGKPQVLTQVENGVAVRVVEFHYIITPLQPGKMIIQPVTIKGNIEAPDIAPMNDPFGGGFSNVFRQALRYFSAFGGEPFSVASNQTLLDVKPPASAMDPWLPLTSLKIIEDIDTPSFARVGEPLTRKLTLLADGAVGKQLPDLEVKQDHANFKVYADKPTTGEDTDAKTGGILGWRKESYSLIPLKAGRLVLPAIHVPWWDIVNNKAAIAELPERVINVLPAAVIQNSPVIGATARPQSMKSGPSEPPQLSGGRPASFRADDALFYIIASILIVGLLLAGFWGLKVWRRTNAPMTDATAPASKKLAQGQAAPKPTTERALKKVQTAAEFKSVLMDYAYENWGASRNSSLKTAFSTLSGSRREFDEVEVVIKGIDAALYAGKAVDLDDLKRRFLRIIATSKKEIVVRGKRSQNWVALIQVKGAALYREQDDELRQSDNWNRRPR